MPPADSASSADALIGSQVGDYRITALLGEGTRGLVYAAEHLTLGHRTACKVLRPEVMRQKDTVERFLQEARQISKIGHRNLIDIFDIGELADGRLYYVMEYLAGRPLTQVLAQGRLSFGEIINLGRQACAGLAAAHAAGLVHRDLCPDNLFLSERPGSAPILKIVGFGFAKVVHGEADLQLTRNGTLLGTPRYMAPEQITEAAVDARTDVYALGAILFELCTGQPPFSGRSLGEVLEGHLRTQVPRLPAAAKKSGVPAAMQAVLDKALAKSPAQRFASAEALADALEHLLPRAPWSLGDGRRSRWLPLAALVVLVGLAAVGGGYLLRGKPQNRPEAAPDLRALHALALQVVTQGLGDADPAVRRQAVIALEQSHDARHKELLVPRLRDADTAVAAAAAHALGEIGNRAAIADLQSRLAQPAAPELLAAGGEALLRLGEPAGRTPLVRAQEPGSAPQVQLASSLALAEAGDPAAALAIERRLQAAPDRGQPSADTLLILTRKARRGDKAAQLRLQELIAAPQAPLAQRLEAASCLLFTGDERARVLLSEAVAAPGPAQFSAAQLLCAADDVSGQPILRQVLAQPSGPLDERVQAAQGLGSCGDQDDAQALGRALSHGEPSPLLQQAEAGALLRLCSADPNILADQSTGWVQLALADGNPSVRAAGATVLGDLPLPQVRPLIQKALHDPSPEVRQSVASALGRSADRQALEPLAAALGDESRAVRLQVWRSIAQIARTLTAQVEDGLERADPIVGLLRQRAAQAVGLEQTAAASALLLAGDRSQRPQVQQALESPDAQTRGIALEAAQSDPVLRPKALTRLIDDAAQSAAQRTRAATELVRAGDSRGVTLLRQVAQQGGADGLAAAVALQPLGGTAPAVAPQERLRELLQRGDAPARREAVAVLASFPVEQAVPLLQQQAHDQDRAVREQVARTAAALRGQGQDPAGGPILRTLLDDPDAGVRAQAGALLAGLRRAGPSESTQSAASKSAAAKAKPESTGAAKEPSGQGRIPKDPVASASAKVPLRSGQETSAPSGAEVPLSPLSGSAKSPTLEEPEAAGANLPASAVAPLVQAGIEAFARKDLRRAKKSLEKAATLCGRRREERPTCQRLAFELSYYLARVYDGQESYAEAMTEYEKILAPHFPAKVKAADRAAVSAAVARLLPRLGQLRVSKLVSGRCQTINLWMPPGRHRVNVGSGQFVQVRAQETIEVKGCP